MKKRYQGDEHEVDRTMSSNSTKMQKKKNLKRLGGGGLSLETFANLKSANSRYNPALIKKQKEFYKNAKYVSKFKKSIKQQNQRNDPSSSQRVFGDNAEAGDKKEINDEQKRKSKNNVSLEEVYRKKHEEIEKARMEKEAMIQAKKEAREKAEARRKAAKEKMLKRTRHGQPVMKYRIEHLLESIKNSS